MYVRTKVPSKSQTDLLLQFKEPINEQKPTNIDKQIQDQLEQFLLDQNLIEPEIDRTTRYLVLSKIDETATQWIQQLTKMKNLSSQVPEPQISLNTFGSFRLGVHGPAADIDTLLIAPHYTSRDEDFFGEDEWCLQQMLKEIKGFKWLQTVAEAYVPVIKLEIDNIQVDLLFCVVSGDVPQQIDIMNNNIFQNMDDKSVVSLNGCRVTDSILKQVPSKRAFRAALRYLKHWAKCRCIYSNVMGYFGGVNLAILVAFLCMKFPKANSSMILIKFFQMFANWDWPMPVLMTPIEYESDFKQNVMVWNPAKNSRDNTHTMPIVTPCYPAMNSTYNVNNATLNILIDEFKRGQERFWDVLQVYDPEQKPFNWGHMTDEFQFFKNFRYYIEIKLTADTKDNLNTWKGYVNSKIRYLVYAIQDIINVRPYPDEINYPNPEDKYPQIYQRLLAQAYQGSKNAANIKRVSQKGNETLELLDDQNSLEGKVQEELKQPQQQQNQQQYNNLQEKWMQQEEHVQNQKHKNQRQFVEMLGQQDGHIEIKKEGEFNESPEESIKAYQDQGEHIQKHKGFSSLGKHLIEERDSLLKQDSNAGPLPNLDLIKDNNNCMDNDKTFNTQKKSSVKKQKTNNDMIRLSENGSQQIVEVEEKGEGEENLKMEGKEEEEDEESRKVTKEHIVLGEDQGGLEYFVPNKYSLAFYLGFKKSGFNKVNITPYVHQFKNELYQWHLHTEDMVVFIRLIGKRDLLKYMKQEVDDKVQYSQLDQNMPPQNFEEQPSMFNQDQEHLEDFPFTIFQKTDEEKAKMEQEEDENNLENYFNKLGQIEEQ